MVFEQDITQVEPSLVPSLLQMGIIKETLAFLHEVRNLYRFTTGLYATIAVSHSLFSDPRAEPLITEIWGSERWQGMRGDLESHGREWINILSETVFLRGYQAFESFLLRLLVCIYYIFPRFLASSPDDIRLGHASFTDLYSAKSILEVRRSFIESRATSEFQAKNIKEQIQSIENKFGINLSLDPDDLKSLVQKSADRNILIHNHGIVNELYLALLRKNRISVKYQVGERISVDHYYTSEGLDLFKKLVEQIEDAVTGNAEHIMKYYQGKFGTFP